jgi:hypothetical protein
LWIHDARASHQIRLQPRDSGSAPRSSPAISATGSGGSFRSSAARFQGEGIKGTILPYGADFQTIRPNGFTELEAKYALRDGRRRHRLHREYSASASVRRSYWTGSPKARIVDPASIYFRSVPKFETGAEKYRWLMQKPVRRRRRKIPDRVEIDVHQVL